MPLHSKRTFAACLLGISALLGTQALGDENKPGVTGYTASIWIDPNGCEHWVIDDGAEGFMSPRLQRDGNPSCPNAASATGTAGLPQIEMDVVAWTDPRGCQHWVSDHGAAGFMSQRINRDGTPVCKGSSVKSPPQTITLNADALFDTNKSDLRPEAIAELDDFGAKMNTLKKRNLLVVGHTDARGSDSYNQGLSERRAKSVASYLGAKFDLAAQTEGRGESDPVADNATKDGRQANRRVEITILD